MQMVWQYSYQGSLADMERVWCHLPERLSNVVIQIFGAMGRLSNVCKKPVSKRDAGDIEPKIKKVLLVATMLL